MNPGRGGSSMNYPSEDVGSPNERSYIYSPQYGQGYNPHPSVHQGHAPFYSSNQRIMISANSSQSSHYSGEQFNCKTPPYQSFQRPYSPYDAGDGSRHGSHQHLQDPALFDVKPNAPKYPSQNYTGPQRTPVAQYVGFNGLDQSTHSSSTFSCPDPSKNLDGFPDGVSRQRYGFFDKPPQALNVSEVQQDLPGENPHVPRGSLDGECKSSRSSESEERLKPDQSEHLDHVPHLSDVAELKAVDFVRQHTDLSPPHAIRGMKRDLSPSNEGQDGDSQDPYVGRQHRGMLAGHSENEFLSGTNEDGTPHQFPPHMNYDSQHQMWNYYNMPHNVYHHPQHDHQDIVEQGCQSGGLSQRPESSGMCGSQGDWWTQSNHGRGGAQAGSGDYHHGFNHPFNIHAPGPWALRGPRPRGERRGPGRPRLNSTFARTASPLLDRRSRMMSPNISSFPSGLGNVQCPVPSPEVEGMPLSPDIMGTTNDDLPRKMQHPLGSEMMATSPGATGSSLSGGGKAGKSNAGNKKRFTCEICQKRFSTAWYVRVHRKSHNGERPYTCDTCGKGFMLPNVLLTHKKKCERQNPGGSLILSSTSQSSPTRQASQDSSSSPPEMRMGSDMHHTSSPLPHNSHRQAFGCQGVGRPFDRDETSTNMMRDIHRGIFPGSPISTQSSPGMGSNYNQTSYPVHNSEEALNCHMPDQSYTSRGYIGGNGVQGYPQGGLQPLSPQFISYSPTSAGMRPPLGSDNSNSSGCSSIPPPTAPIIPNNQQPHFLAIDPPSDEGGGHGGRLERGELPPVNKVPLKTVAQGESNYHKDEKPSEKSSENVLRPHSCEICGKKFSQKCNLITHKRIHTGERPHTCFHCDKKFTQKGNLDAHLKTHSKEKPQPCNNSCDKKFAKKTSLLRQGHLLMDENKELRQLSSPTSSLSPSDLEPTSPINRFNFIPGIPTPRSSLESINNGSGLCVQGNARNGFNECGTNSNYLPLNACFPPPSPSDLSDISKLTATVEAATMRCHYIFPPRSLSTSSSSASS